MSDKENSEFLNETQLDPATLDFKKETKTRRDIKKPHKCPICSKGFRSPSALAVHYSIHSGLKPFQCAICSRPFRTKDLLRIHQQIHNPNRKQFQKCPNCPKSFFQLHHLRFHLKTHSNTKPFHCFVCQKRFLARQYLTRHQFSHQKENKRFQCPRCPFRTHASFHLSAHIKRIHEKWRLETFHCIFCPKSFTLKYNFENHLRAHLQERPFACNFCPKKFPSNSYLSNHLRSVHSANRKREFECKVCKKRSFTKGNLEQHMKTHSGEKTFKCTGDNCKMLFLTKVELKRHFVCRHTSEKPFQCDVCSKRFKLVSLLNLHKKIHDPTMEKKFECEQCKNRFRTKSLLQNHMLTHQVDRERSHLCSVCGKGFTSQKILRLHLEIHFGVERFRCEVCGKGFVKIGNYKAHLVSHSREKTFRCLLCNFKTTGNRYLRTHVKKMHQIQQRKLKHECLFCDKKFPDWDDLLHHTRSHTLEKPYFCKICRAEFSMNGNRLKHEKHIHDPNRKRDVECLFCPKLFLNQLQLKAHLRTHLGEKTHKCGECGKDFVTGVELKRHLSTHSESRPFECEVCGKAFKSLAAINKHRKACHQGKQISCRSCHFKTNTKQNLRRHWMRKHGPNEFQRIA